MQHGSVVVCTTTPHLGINARLARYKRERVETLNKYPDLEPQIVEAIS